MTYDEKSRGATKRMGARRGRVCRGTMREERIVGGRGFAFDWCQFDEPEGEDVSWCDLLPQLWMKDGV